MLLGKNRGSNFHPALRFPVALPLVKIMEKMMMAVVAFLAKLEASTTSVAKEIIHHSQKTPRLYSCFFLAFTQNSLFLSCIRNFSNNKGSYNFFVSCLTFRSDI